MATRIRTIATDNRGYFTDVGVRTAPPREKPYRLSEPSGLCLLIKPTGTRSWQYRHRFLHETTQLWTETIVSLGSYPNVGLREARAALESAKTKVASGNMDDLRRRRRFKGEPAVGEGWLLRTIGEEWLQTARRELAWSDETHRQISLRWAKYVEPPLGHRDIRSITAEQVEAIVAKIRESDSTTVLKRVVRVFRDVFVYATKRKLLTVNPISGIDLMEGHKPAKVKHHASFNRPDEVRLLLHTIDTYQGEFTRRGLTLLAHVFVRPSELKNARWSEIDFDTSTWEIPAERMKMRNEHIVPLSRQVVAQLQELRAMSTGSEFVIPGSSKEGTMSHDTLRNALEKLGYGKEKFTPHGFRAMARTMLDEQLHMNCDWIEAQLAHKPKGSFGAAYNRSTYLQARRSMMQVWSDYLDKLVAGSTE